MELQSVTLNGFRRFAEPTELRTNGKLVALLGPNEAGKTSILNAISQIGLTQPIPKSDLTRGTSPGEDDIIISARFRLEADDLVTAQIEHPTWYILEKSPTGKQTHRFEPPVRTRDIGHRQKVKSALARVKANNRLWGRLVQAEPDIPDLVEAAEGALDSKSETIAESHIKSIDSLREAIREQPEPSDPAYFRDLPARLLDTLETEKAPTPSQNAYSVVFKRVPRFLLFTNEDRLLQGSYAFDDLEEKVPSALDNIARVAGLDVAALIEAVSDEDTPQVARLKMRANNELQERFRENWSQSNIHVAFEVINEELQVLVQEEGYNFTKLAERSDGLRQFVALQAFTTRERAENPVLLIDEAEMRLHYDAQADLIQMLSRQTVAPKVIYTTHSVGCLPEDLGNGVRLIDYSGTEGDGAKTSVVRNHFWLRDKGGLEPLLYGMGAATLAFFPIRRALLTEGESDMLLLPTLFRECFGAPNLDFQVVPGLSKTSGINLPILSRNGRGVGFIVDFDQGGKDIQRKIVDAGFDRSSVFFLKGSTNQDTQLEDFLDPKLLALGANFAFSATHPKKPAITASKFRSSGRLRVIAAHYGLKKVGDVPKTAIAYAILDHLSAYPEKTLLDPKKKAVFDQAARNIRAYLAN